MNILAEQMRARGETEAESAMLVQKALVKVLPTAVNTFATPWVTLFSEAIAPSPMRAAMRAYSIKSWPDSS